MSQTRTRISISDVIGLPFAVSTEKAQLVYEELNHHLSRERPVALSFEGVTHLVAVFLNVAVGHLYSKFSSGYIERYLELVDATPEQLATFNRVVDNAKWYVQNSKAFEKAYRSLAEHPGFEA